MPIASLDDWLRLESGETRHPLGRRVFLRSDLNVPLEGKEIRDDTRLRASVGTLQRLTDAGARVILASHLGRPKGQPSANLSLAPVAKALNTLIPNPVAFVPDCIGKAAEAASFRLGEGEILVLENLRFHSGETANDRAFASGLARLADCYVNDAFGTAHRAHASTTGIVEFLPDAVAGDLLLREIEHLGVVLEPERPLLCLLGGAKVSDKLGVLKALCQRADVLAIGGAMAYTFMAAQGLPVGQSLVEVDRLEDSRNILAIARENACRLLLPIDHVIARSLENGSESRITEQIPEGYMGVDIGPETSALYAHEAGKARTILWNGPMGVFEVDPFDVGTGVVARAVADSPATAVVGGGDSLAAINRLGMASRIDHLSTGGGASLEFVQGLTLPGIAALEN